MTASLASIAATAAADPTAAAAAYRAALAAAVSARDAGALDAYVDHVLSDAVPLTLSRSLVADLAPGLASLPPADAARAARRALAALDPRAVSHGDAVAALRETLAGAYEALEEWGDAAAALAGVDVDGAPPPARLRHAVRVAMLYLEADDAASADAHVKKAASLVAGGAADGDPGAALRARTCAARVLDARRDYAKAAAAYLDVAWAGRAAVGADGVRIISDADVDTALSSAVTCAVLAPPSAARARVLAALARDDRAATGLPLSPVLRKVAATRLLRAGDVAALEAGLAPHHRAVGGGGVTVVSRAVVAHNVAAAARVYASLSLADLGDLLGVGADAAEGVAAGLVADGGVDARIDQVAGVVRFGVAARAARPAGADFDGAVADVCAALDAAAA